MNQLNVLLIYIRPALAVRYIAVTLLPIVGCLLYPSSLSAAPSGGPYGPIPQNYPLPEIAGNTYFVSPDADSEATGTNIETPTTLEAAISRVVSGDAIVLRGGTYRIGDLRLNQSILMQPYLTERPVIKGTFVAEGWENVVPAAYRNRFGNLWAVSWDRLFPSAPDGWWRREMAGMQTRLHKFNNDLLFIDGRMLQSTDWFEGLNENTFFIDYENRKVYLSENPTGKTIEITAFNQGLIITTQEVHGKQADKKGPTIRGIDFTQYAFHILDVEGFYADGPASEAELGKDIVGTTIEHCSFTYAGRVGAFIFGDKLTMRHCKISDTSTEGLYLMSGADALLEKNIFTRNNIEQITGYYPAAVKVFNQTHRVVCNDNLIIDLPDSNGIWYDVGNIDGVFTNNWIQNVGSTEATFDNGHVWPSRNGFFFEISKGATLAGNVFVDNDHAMLILNSSDVNVFNNTFINSLPVFARDSRGDGSDHFGWHVTTGPGVDDRDGHSFYNNLLVNNGTNDRPLLSIWQLAGMCERLTTPALKTLSNNAYFKLKPGHAPIVMLNQKIGDSCISELHTIEALAATVPGYGKGSFMAPTDSPSPFVNTALQRYELIDGSVSAIPAPLEIPKNQASAASMDSSPATIGAY